jgi:hypothetical protein
MRYCQTPLQFLSPRLPDAPTQALISALKAEGKRHDAERIAGYHDEYRRGLLRDASSMGMSMSALALVKMLEE